MADVKSAVGGFAKVAWPVFKNGVIGLSLLGFVGVASAGGAPAVAGGIGVGFDTAVATLSKGSAWVGAKLGAVATVAPVVPVAPIEQLIP